MKAFYIPSGGRFGYGFNYYCSECMVFLGNSTDDKQLIHPTELTHTKWFRKVSKPIQCQHAGKDWPIPRHEIALGDYQ